MATVKNSALKVTIHNLPEGMAVGVVFAGAENGAPHISLAAAISVSLGIAIQNIPEGAIISMPMRAAGNSRWRSFVLGSLSRVMEPIGAMPYCCLPPSLCPPTLHARLCSWRHVLCGGGGADT